MDIDGSLLPDDEVLAYALFLFVAGVETTERTLCHLTRHMVDRPEDWQRLAADRQLVLPAIAETLRFTPPVHALTRAVAIDTEISGTPIAAGSKVLAVIAAANRDPNVFDDPEVFRIDRFLDNPIREFTAASLSLAFGTGLHQCTGSLLSRLEMELAANGMLDRFERISWVGDRPNDRGYVLRAPTGVRVVCHPRA
jgi:cytochrome P450